MKPVAINTPDAWPLQTRSGLTVFVPPRVQSLSTYVLLEQERWFEPEMDLLPLLLHAGMNALDIGANHGLYTLELARLTAGPADSGSTAGPAGAGQVWAFEPTPAPRALLQRSARANGLASRIHVAAVALGEHNGWAEFAQGEHSEHNARVLAGSGRGRQPTVRMSTLDSYLAEHASDVDIDFIKLDAEGSELQVLAGARQFFAQQSPMVLFEFKHGDQVNQPLLAAWQALGYACYRWSAELQLLLPFDAAQDETTFALNLLALRAPAVASLAARGLLLTSEALASAQLPVPDGRVLTAWMHTPALVGQTPWPESPGSAAGPFNAALTAVASAHGQDRLDPAQRVLLVLWAREQLLGAVQAGEPLGVEAFSLLVHCLLALGQQAAAVAMADELLAFWPDKVQISGPFMPPQRADLQRPHSGPAADFLHQRLAEFAALRRAHSSFFQAPEPERWAALWASTAHSAAVERAGLLVHLAAGQAAPVQLLRHLSSGGPGAARPANAAFWAALIEQLGDDGVGALPLAAQSTSLALSRHNAALFTSHQAV